MNPCGAARTNPHGCRTTPHGRRTDTLPLPHGQFANLITITTTKTPHGQLVNLITLTTRDNNMSVRRPSGAARTSVRPHGQLKWPHGQLNWPHGRPCGHFKSAARMFVRIRAASVQFLWCVRAAPHGSVRRRTALDGMSPLLTVTSASCRGGTTGST